MVLFFIIISWSFNLQKKTFRAKPPKVESGQLVTAKAKNGRYYTATVRAMFMELFYEVDFTDGSFSKDLYPQDIVVSFLMKVW